MRKRTAGTRQRHQPPALHVDAGSYVPFYQQIVEQFRDLIKSGALREGEVFRSEGELAAELGISKMPVRQAFAKLRADGLLQVEKGKRPLVGSSQVPWSFQQLRGFSEEMRRRGLVPSSRLLGIRELPANAEVAKALRIPPGTSTWELRRLRFVNGEPVALVTSHLPAAVFPGLDRHSLAKASLYALFEKTYRRRLGWAEEEFSATVATAAVARALGTRAGRPLLCVRETTFDVGRTAIEFSLSLLRADRYKATVISVRKRQS